MYGRTSDPRHHELVQEILLELHENGYLIQETMEQFCSVGEGGKLGSSLTGTYRGSAPLAPPMGLEATSAMHVELPTRQMN